MEKSRTESRADAIQELFEALLLLEDSGEVERFMKDLCTPGEISALAERWLVCRLLESGQLSYRAIHQETGASLATITRVARFLKDEPHHGYKAILYKTRCKKKNENDDRVNKKE